MKTRLFVLLSIVVATLAILTPTLSTPVSVAATDPTSFSVKGLDLHDGKMLQVGGTYYLYGTQYACGFTWGQANTPWCGFGVSTSTDKINWTAPTKLFSPSDVDSWTGTTWAVECGATGAGCFNPRMIQRSGWGANDGAWILWFNAPADYSRTKANAYYAMGCNSPTGPCGDGAGAPNGSTHKPSLYLCGGNGDFDIIVPPTGSPVMLCTQANQTLAAEQIDQWGTNGVNIGAKDLAGLTSVESPGAYYDITHSTWVMTYSDPNCGYCNGTGTGYATATNLTGPWTAPAGSGVSAPATGRRDLSATSCGGQARTISTIDGHPYQGIDLWNGSLNETAAGLHFEPLTYTAPSTTTSPWQPFEPFTCNG